MGNVSPDALARLAAMQRPAESVAGGSGWTYDARAMLEANDADLTALGITTGKLKARPDGGQLWELTGCPYSHDHDDAAFRMQYPDGGLHLGCHHARCQGKTITSAPDLFPRTVAVKGTPPANTARTFGGTANGTRSQNVGNAGDAGPGEPEAPAPLWPAGILPEAIDNYVTAQARAIGVPVDMVAVPLLVFAGGAIGNAVELQLKSGWTVLPSLWAGLIADPGKKKSPTLKAAQWPSNTLQKRLYDQWQADMAQYEADLQAWDAKPKGDRGEKPQPPLLDHLYTTDATVEALVGMLSCGPGLSIVMDELSGFIASFDKYRGGKGGDRQQYLSLWGHAPIKADRKGGGTVYATHPVGCVYGGIQPDLAHQLHSRNGQRDGMVERFNLFWPDVRRSGWTDDAVDPALLDPVVVTFEALRSILKRTMEDVAHGRERVTVQMHPDARAVFVDWYNANDDATERVTGLRQGFYSKLDSQLARIALILHCLWNPDDPRVMLQAETMRAAIAVAEFFRTHLDRVLPLLSNPRNAGMPSVDMRILRHLRNTENQNADGWVARSVLYNRLRNVEASAFSDALERLATAGAIESRTNATATKPAEAWRIREQTSFIHSDYSEDPSGTAPIEPEKIRIIGTYEPGITESEDDAGHQPTGTDGRVKV